MSPSAPVPSGKLVDADAASSSPAPVARPSALLRDLGTIPNLLSLSRLVLIVVSAALYLGGYPIAGLALGVATGLTDYFDGWLARRWNQVTELGAILDRLGDLVVEVVSFVVATWFHLFPPVLFILYLVREFLVASARLYCAQQRWPMPSSFFGKLKTNFLGYSFLVAYVLFARVIPGETAARVLEILAWVGVSLGLVCSYISGLSYLGAFVKAYNRER